MIRFLVGLILGGVLSGAALSVAAILNPLADGPVAGMLRSEPATIEAPAPVAAPAPEIEPVAPTSQSEASAPEAPVTTDAAPSVPTSEAAPVAEGPRLTAPDVSESAGAGLGGGGDNSPNRSPSAPQQVAVAAPTVGAPAVDTESVSAPQVGGPELNLEEESLGPAPDLVEGDALVEHAIAFGGDPSRPMMSIILIDEGGSSELRAGLTALTAPITFGITADIEGAGDVAEQYAGAGFELVAVLPQEGNLALTTDSETDEVTPTIARVLANVPNAATILDPIDSPLPQNRRLAGALLETLKRTGHGLLTHRGNGLNNVPIIADQEGVPSELIYRVIDEVPGSANIALALERAVLDASRGGSVIVVGRVRQETVTTLFSWLLGSGAREVTIAPVSAILQKRAL